jgi:glucose/arabinose dehydrogenase
MRLSFVFFCFCVLVACAPTEPTNPPGGTFEDTLVTAVSQPTAFAFMPGGRMLIASKTGTLNVFANGALEPALTLSNACDNSERGLLGVAVDPEFASNQFIYLYYTAKNSTNCETKQDLVPVNRVSRFVFNENSVEVSSETILIDNIPSFAGNHNAGDVQFGKDGYLYISTGDGGCDYTEESGCAGGNAIAKSNNHLLGKILRMTRDGGIPADNPFRGSGSARCNETGSTTTDKICQEIYATGLRNPFRIAFDPNTPETRFYINDVGQEVWEEVNVGAAGADYGWNSREGKCTNNSATACDAPPPNLVDPLFTYKHGENPAPSPFQNCNSITAGAFVPEGVWPESYNGAYLFADVTCGRIFSLAADGAVSLEAEELGAVVHMGFGPFEDGQALYYSRLDNGGEIRRIVYKQQ